MSLSQRVLRWLCAKAEQERREFRQDINWVQAHAEDLSRIVRTNNNMDFKRSNKDHAE